MEVKWIYHTGLSKHDTDSNFLYLDALYNHICSNAGLDLSRRSQKSNIINICTVIVYICSQYVQTIMDTHTSNVNIPPNKMPIINMKSELNQRIAHVKVL